MSEIIYAADLFAGAGGTSTGLVQAIQELKLNIDLTAVNHWEKALKTHEANYPWAKHLPANIEAVNPQEAIPGKHLHLLVASPECTHHSRAAGGRPKNEQKRSSAWAIFRWLEMINVDSVLVENVAEFQMWGPLDAEGQPIKLRRGEIYRAWLRCFRAHGYTVEAKVLNAANYGAATSRSRLFVLALRGKKKPVFPTPTHSKEGWPTHKWRPARSIIDWSLKGESIYNRKRPLSPRTMQRIMEGLKRFGGRELKPFIILMEHAGGVHSVEEPLHTITTAKGGAMGLAEPETFILSQASGGAPRRVEDPLPTITTDGAHALVEPFIVRMEQTNCLGPKVKSINTPLPTITTNGRIGMAEPFIVPNFGEDIGQIPRTHSIDEPLPSVTSHGAGNLVQPFYIEYYGTGGAKSVDEPLRTIPTKDRFGLAEPYVLQFNGSQESQIKNSAISVENPLPALATKAHFGLVQPSIDGKTLDIRFRMLQPRELAKATGFPDQYQFLGTKTETVKMIGNAVVVEISKALCLSLLKKVI
jgi:DNA (cytosine-5)-methyltransferase 1